MQGLRIAMAILFLVTLAACQAPTFASPQPAPMPGVEVEMHVDYVTLSTEEAIRQASAIVIGRVKDISAPRWNQDSGEYWDDSSTAMSSLLYNEATLVVEASIRGGYQAGEKITLTILGNSRDETFLQTGERVLVMLEKRAIAWRNAPRERVVVVGGPQGKYHLTQDGQALNAADPRRSMALEQLLAQIASATTPKDKGTKQSVSTVTLQSPRAPTSTAVALETETLTASTDDLSAARAALGAYEPVTDARPTVNALLNHIAHWLQAGGNPAELEAALDEAVTLNPSIGPKSGSVRIRAFDLTGDGDEDVVVQIPVTGLPLLVFVDEKGTFAGYALPPNYAETLIHSWPVDPALTLWGMPQPPLELVDLTGDGVAEILLTYLFPGSSAFHLQPIVFQWHAGDFRPVFAAHLVNWAGQAGLALETDPTGAGGRQIVLRYPYLYGDGFDHKMVNHPLGEEIWRWSESAGRFVRAEARADLERSGWGPDAPLATGDQLRWFTNEGEQAFRHSGYAAALGWYNQALGLAAAQEWAPGDEDPDWRGYTAFRRAETLLLHGGQDPDVPPGYAPDGLTAMQAVAQAYQGDMLGELANAFLDGYAGGSDEDAAAGGVAAMQSVDLYTFFYYEGSKEPGALRFPMDAGGVLYPGAGLAAYLQAHSDLADDPEALRDGLIKAGFAAKEVEEAQGGQVQIGLRLPDAPNADGRLALWTLAEGAPGWQVVSYDTHPYRGFDSLLLDRSAGWPVAGDFQTVSSFEDCYRLVFSANTGQEQDWFCPGTGRVRREYHHKGSRLDEVWELQAFYTSTTTIPSPSKKPAEQTGAGGQPPGDTEHRVDCGDQAPGLPDTLQIITADGAQLAFAGEGGGVTLLNLTTGHTQTFSQTLSFAGWSPSGQHLLLGYSEFRYRGNFVVPRQTFWAPPEALPGATDWLALTMADGALLAVSVPGGQCYRVLPPGSLGEGGVGSILWSADGWLAWTGGLDHLAQTETWTQTLYLQPVAGTEVITRSLSGDIRETYYRLIAWVPGRRLILAAEGMLANSLWSWGVPLVTINADTGEITDLGVSMLLTSEAYAWHPTRPGWLALAEGGSRYLFETGRLALIDVASGELHYLTGPDIAAFEPAWSADGSWLAYAALPASPHASGDGRTLENTLDGRAIYAVNPQTGETRQLTHPGEAMDGWPRWSADGDRLLYARRQEGRTDVRVVSLSGDRDELLVASVAGPERCYYGGCGWEWILAYNAGPLPKYLSNDNFAFQSANQM